MTTIRDELLPSDVFWSAERSAGAMAALEALDIDPDLPAEWATVDRCLTWLTDRHWSFMDATAVWMDGDTAKPGWAIVVLDDGTEADHCGEAATFHAALTAACKAVQEAP